MTTGSPVLQLADSILYLSSLIADQPREIDRYIDYFGGLAGAAPPLAIGASSIPRQVTTQCKNHRPTS
jgi:hypothetical protein